MTRRTIERVPSALVGLTCICVLIGMLALTGGGFGLLALQDRASAQSVIDPDVDSDGDGIMNSHDPDDDNDGIPDDIDADPFDPSIPGVAPTPNSIDPDADSDGDGIKNSHDPDDDNDAEPDKTDPDPFVPEDSTEEPAQPEVPSGPGSTVSDSDSSQVAVTTSGNANSSARAGLVTKLPNTGQGQESSRIRPVIMIGLALIAVLAAGSSILLWVASRFAGDGMRR